MTDFILATEQQATFLFINVAPQWQTFNGQNWVAVEISARKLASDRGIYLDVYSGVFGVTQLWDENNIRHGIFLDWPAAKIPVPQLYYKILVNNANRSGVVLIGVNNPHLSLQDIQQRGYIVCEDKSDQITWVSWQRTDLRRGYSYACDVNDFLARVPHVSGLNVQSLLV
jgi:DNA/RNA endonuclease G (NUC1)